MRTQLLILAHLGLASALLGADQPDTPFKTPKERLSYAFGMNFGTMLKRELIDVDTEVLAKAMRDVLAGGKTALTETEVREAIQAELTARRNEKQRDTLAKQKQASEGNRKIGEAFLAENKKKDGVTTLPSGLQYKVIKMGAGPKPTPTDKAVCHYRGTLIDGKEFDSSYTRGEPATFPVTGVIKGWTEALQLMPAGSKWQLFIPSDLAYGDAGTGQDIQGGATLLFDIELLSIQAGAATPPPAAPPNVGGPTQAVKPPPAKK